MDVDRRAVRQAVSASAMARDDARRGTGLRRDRQWAALADLGADEGRAGAVDGLHDVEQLSAPGNG